jgi:hypothetical protein
MYKKVFTNKPRLPKEKAFSVPHIDVIIIDALPHFLSKARFEPAIVVCKNDKFGFEDVHLLVLEVRGVHEPISLFKGDNGERALDTLR